jgi:two-component system OmpR family response regulator
MRLLLLEDDSILGEGLRDYLRSEGHVVEWFTHLAEVQGMNSEPFDALLVDWSLPDGTGIDWIRTLRRTDQSVPVIMLTARDRLADRIQGLDSGADDYLVKPFAPEELSARLRALARRNASAVLERRRFGHVEVSLTARQSWLDDVAVDLTAREWAVLEALVLRAGRIVTKADLSQLIHGFDGDVTSNVLEVHISALRRKLTKELIETVRGLGYRVPT